MHEDWSKWILVQYTKVEHLNKIYELQTQNDRDVELKMQKTFIRTNQKREENQKGSRIGF